MPRLWRGLAAAGHSMSGYWLIACFDLPCLPCITRGSHTTIACLILLFRCRVLLMVLQSILF